MINQPTTHDEETAAMRVRLIQEMTECPACGEDETEDVEAMGPAAVRGWLASHIGKCGAAEPGGEHVCNEPRGHAFDHVATERNMDCSANFERARWTR